MRLVGRGTGELGVDMYDMTKEDDLYGAGELDRWGEGRVWGEGNGVSAAEVGKIKRVFGWAKWG